MVAQQAVTVTGASGALTANASLQLTLMSVTIPDAFRAVGGVLAHGFYDESRQLLYATNPGLNELDVFSGVDFSIKARVPVLQPWGIDQMADGKTLVLGTAAQEILTVDEDTFAVTPHPYAAAPSVCSLFFPNVVALANGVVLMIGQMQGIDSDNIHEAGQYVYQWNSGTNTFSQLEPSAQYNGASWGVDSLARSADHKWAVFAADQFYLYSSDSSSFTTVPLSSVNPPQDDYGIRGYAINADGTEIAVASATQVTFLDRSLTVLGIASIPGAFTTSGTAQFSSDGSRLYLQFFLPVAIEEVDARIYYALGYLSGTMNPDFDNLERMLTTDSKGRAYVGINGGLRVVDLTTPPVPNPSGTNPPLNGPFCPVLNAVLPLNQAAQMQFSGQATSVYIGGKIAPLLSGGAEIIVPASSVVGPADTECVDSYGNTSIALAGVSYGVDLLGLSANLLPPAGNSQEYLFGYGFSASQGELPSVTLAGQAVANTTSVYSAGLGVLQGEGFKTPAGTPGESAKLEVSSSAGSATLASAATYYPSPTIVPASGLLRLLYDNQRNLLYALKATEVDVLNPTTLYWEPPLKFPAAATANFNTMELSPDGTMLVIAGLTTNSTGGTAIQLIVLNPDNSSLASVFTYSSASTILTSSIAVTKFNTVVLAGYPGAAFDPSTSTFTVLPNPGPPIDVVRASADGSHIYGAALYSSSGEVASYDPSTYASQSEQFGELFWSDLAVSPDGSQFAAVLAPYYYTGDAIGFFDSGLHYLNTNIYPAASPPDDHGVTGAMFSPGGKVLVVPLGDSLEIWDSTLGTLRARLMTPEELTGLWYSNTAVPMITMDPTGQSIYAISKSGLTVLTLPQPLDQTPATQWRSNARSSEQNAWLHGTITSRMTAMRKKLRKGGP